MKTARILLYPNEFQADTLRKLSEQYCSLIIDGISNPIDQAYDFKSLSPSSILQLKWEISRLRNRKKTDWTPRTNYCKWGDDYHLSEQFLMLPLNQAEVLLIPCKIRPFQKRMLEGKHPSVLTLKKMKKHWYAYLIVKDEEIH